MCLHKPVYKRCYKRLANHMDNPLHNLCTVVAYNARVNRIPRILLVASLAIALVVTLLFGVRLVRRIIDRPTNEPIREWMSVPYVAHSYRVPPRVLFDALGLPDSPGDRRPLRDIARDQNRTVDNLIQTLQDAIERERQARRPPAPPGPDAPPPAPTAVPTTTTSAG